MRLYHCSPHRYDGPPYRKWGKILLDKCFTKVGNNLIYSTLVIARLLVEAAKLHDSIREITNEPDSDSIFKRIEHASLDLIRKAFELHINSLFRLTGDYFKPDFACGEVRLVMQLRKIQLSFFIKQYWSTKFAQL